jgi:hypothetical protein
MAFAPNNDLITSANVIGLEGNGVNGDTYAGIDGQADTFLIAEGSGDDAITNFDVNDTIITGKKIFDGNGDGYIAFGPNSLLDVDRTSSRRAGESQIAVSGNGNDRVEVIRYLGMKEGVGAFAYGAADVRDNFLGHFTRGADSTNGVTGGDATIATFQFKYDNQVDNKTFDFSKGSSVLLVDNATGLNFGSDTITGFGTDDLLVTTSKIYDSNDSGIVRFATNSVLDLSGSTGGNSNDPDGGPGGQIDTDQTGSFEAVAYLGSKSIGDTTYYYYGSTSHSGSFRTGTYESTYAGPDLGFGI